MIVFITLQQQPPRLYENVAKQVAIDRCINSSFGKFKKTLQEWFWKRL